MIIKIALNLANKKHWAAICVLLILTSIHSQADNKSENKNIKNKCEIEKKLPSMGTFFELQLTVPCSDQQDENLFVKIQQTLDRLESQMSLYQSSSPISQLNREGKLMKLPQDMFRVLTLSVEAAKQTDGAFDITILPVLKLIQDSFRTKSTPPSDSQLSQLRKLIDYKKILLKRDSVEFQIPKMMISLDGIAKGYAVDMIAEQLEQLGLTDYLLNFSGNMRWSGVRSDNKPWRIMIWNPVELKAVSFKTPLTGAIASSGNDINAYSGNKKWHHIISPKTLHPVNIWAQTTVYGPRATVCDFLSTATYVMEKDEIHKIMGLSFKDYKLWAVTHDKQVFTTAN